VRGGRAFSRSVAPAGPARRRQRRGPLSLLK
jgi:hypothetical protein